MRCTCAYTIRVSTLCRQHLVPQFMGSKVVASQRLLPWSGHGLCATPVRIAVMDVSNDTTCGHKGVH